MSPKDELTFEVDGARLARNWAAIERRLDRRRRRWTWGVASTAVAGLSALVFILPPSPRPGPLTSVSGQPVSEALARAEAVVWSDGSRTVPAPGASLELVENSGDRIAFRLRQGRVRFEVEPGGPRAWTVAAGRLEVEVLGTVFEVERRAGEDEVRVERGRVRVDSSLLPRGSVVLLGPELGEGPRRVVLPIAPSVDRPPAASPTEPEPGAAEPAFDRRRARRWAKARVKPSLPSARAPTAAELLSQADRARRAGELARALALLTAAAERTEEPEAGLASFTLGRLLAEQGRREDAASAFARALELGLPTAMAERAQARLRAFRDAETRNR